MDSGNKSSILLTLIAALCIVAVVATPVACMVHEVHTLGQMVKAGADPIAARCALGHGSVSMCIIAAQKASKP